MIVHAHVQIQIEADELTQIYADIDDTIRAQIEREVVEALQKSEAFMDLKKAIYEACLERIRSDIAKEYIEKVKGES